jgi:hypothetical protein
VRELEDLNPIPDEQGGNNFFINGNMKLLTACDTKSDENVESAPQTAPFAPQGAKDGLPAGQAGGTGKETNSNAPQAVAQPKKKKNETKEDSEEQ